MSEIKQTRDDIFFFPKMLLFYRAHPVMAVKDLLGINLAPHQRLDLRLTWHTLDTEIIRLMGRGMSKTFGDALEAVLAAMLYPRLKILTLGAEGFRQGKFVLENCENIIKCKLDGQRESRFSLNMIDMEGKRSMSSVIKKDPDMWRIIFKNGSEIATAPLGNKGEAIRGFRAHKTKVDERRLLAKEIKDQIINPFSIVDYNVVTVKGEYTNKNTDSGTLQYEEDDYTKEWREYLRHMKKGDKGFLVIKFIYPDAYQEAVPGEDYVQESNYFGKKFKFWKTPYSIRVDKIERELEKQTVDIESWRAEHTCVPMRATGDYYSYDLIFQAGRKKVISDEEYMALDEERQKKATQFLRPKTFCDDPVIIAVDNARESDMTAVSVIRLGPLSLKMWDPVSQEGKTPFSNFIYAYQERHMHDPAVAEMIYVLLERFPHTKIVCMDKRGGGSGVRDQLYHVVKDKKVAAEILFDPNDNDEGGIATLLGGKSGNNRLRLLMYGDMENTETNRSIRTGLGEGKLYFPGGEDFHDPELDDVQNVFNVMMKQFRMIKTTPTKNWLNFHTPDPKEYLKDLYSTAVYGWGEVSRILYNEGIAKKHNISNIAPVFTVR